MRGEFELEKYYTSFNKKSELLREWSDLNNKAAWENYKTEERKTYEYLESSISKCLEKIESQKIPYERFIDLEIEEIIERKAPLCKTYFIISLICEKPSKKLEDHLTKMCTFFLSEAKLNSLHIYYLESMIDIWNYTLESLVPLSILEGICLKEQSSSEYSYGALIKAASYLQDHPMQSQLSVLEKVEKLDRFKNDGYFRSWFIDEESE